jgi:hypothetical protein
MKTLAPVLLCFAPSIAVAKSSNGNDPISMVISMVVMVLLVLICYAAVVMNQQTPEERETATQANIDKMEGTSFLVTYVNQSGNTRSQYTFLTKQQAMRHITSTFNRSSIKDNYNVSADKNGNIFFQRVFHNGRGRKEGKVLGGAILSVAT